MVKENPDGNTSSENDPTESSSEDDRNLGKRQKVEEKEEESVEREEGEVGEEDEVKEESEEGEESEEKEECEEKEEDEEKEESGEEIEEIEEIKEIEEIEEGEESEEGEECEESEKEESKSSDDEIESDPDEESGDEAEIDEELEDEDESPLDELIFHLRGEEMSFIEERQKELAKAAKQGEDQASSSTAKKPLPMIIIHHSEGELFEKRALEAKEAIEDRVPGIHIYVNPRQKYRLGIFYIRSEDEREYIGLRMEPPFTELVDLDIDNLAWEVSVYMKYH